MESIFLLSFFPAWFFYNLGVHGNGIGCVGSFSNMMNQCKL